MFKKGRNRGNGFLKVMRRKVKGFFFSPEKKILREELTFKKSYDKQDMISCYLKREVTCFSLSE